ncbi:hypothetical protein [Streptomyces sp. 8N616]|uniref:hypothetical protein n=1 Tax=Streptomyces sp. 8N616 TaxID=3457414 RepID=UPI003FD5F57B
MTEQDAGSYRLRMEGDNSGQIVIGDGNSVVVGQAAESVDVARLAEFAQAVSQAIPVLGLREERQRTAEELTRQILQAADEPGADPRRLRALGQSLRAVLEGAVAGALSAGLLAIWTP